MTFELDLRSANFKQNNYKNFTLRYEQSSARGAPVKSTTTRFEKTVNLTTAGRDCCSERLQRTRLAKGNSWTTHNSFHQHLNPKGCLRGLHVAVLERLMRFDDSECFVGKE